MPLAEWATQSDRTPVKKHHAGAKLTEHRRSTHIHKYWGSSRMRITKKKIVVAVAAASVVALGSTAAFAFFTTTGSGSGSATVGSRPGEGARFEVTLPLA